MSILTGLIKFTNFLALLWKNYRPRFNKNLWLITEKKHGMVSFVLQDVLNEQPSRIKLPLIKIERLSFDRKKGQNMFDKN